MTPMENQWFTFASQKGINLKLNKLKKWKQIMITD